MSKYKYIVVQEFRDINDFNLKHKVGSDVTFMHHDRRGRLVDLDLVVKEEIKPEPPPKPTAK